MAENGLRGLLGVLLPALLFPLQLVLEFFFLCGLLGAGEFLELRRQGIGGVKKVYAEFTVAAYQFATYSTAFQLAPESSIAIRIFVCAIMNRLSGLSFRFGVQLLLENCHDRSLLRT